MKEKPKYFIDGAKMYYKTVGVMTYWLDNETGIWHYFCKTVDIDKLVELKELTKEQEEKLKTKEIQNGQVRCQEDQDRWEEENQSLQY